MNGIHVFVFCRAEYKDLVGYCVQSIQKYVTDNILSINVVSNLKIKVDSANLILDQNFWKIIDPEWKYRRLYNSNWIKQQIFKLSVDKYVNGNVLIVDAEVLFLKPTTWIDCGKINFYTSYSPRYEPYFTLNKALANVDQQISHSFITDAMVFSTEVLQSLKNDIETLHGELWLDTLTRLALDTPKNALSEFELYGNYVLDKYPKLIGKLNNPVQHVINLNNRQNYLFDVLIQIIKQNTNNDYVSVNIDAHSYASKTGYSTSWLSFYEQIRDPTWPDCDLESDFCKLPKHIQKECIEVFGYKQKLDL